MAKTDGRKDCNLHGPKVQQGPSISQFIGIVRTPSEAHSRVDNPPLFPLPQSLQDGITGMDFTFFAMRACSLRRSY